jgi:hypothetical protein
MEPEMIGDRVPIRKCEDVTLLLTGDLVLDVDRRLLVVGHAAAVREADVAIGHLEVPIHHGTESGRRACPGAPPENLTP